MPAIAMLTTLLMSIPASTPLVGAYEMPRATLDQWTCDYDRCSDTPPHGKLILKRNDGVLTLSGWQEATLARATPIEDGFAGRSKADKHWDGSAEQWDFIFMGDGEFLRGMLMRVQGAIGEDGKSIAPKSQCLCVYLFEAMRIPSY